MGSLAREENLERLRDREAWDVVVIGGGATGLGSAVDAAARGYRTLLLEARDFAQGTSSRSTKLIHGGVRYLAQGDIAPGPRGAARARGLVPQRPAPGPSPRLRGAGLPMAGPSLLRDRPENLRLAGRPLRARAARAGSGRPAWSRDIPTIVSEGLRGGIVYTDGQFDDARLAISLARTLADSGGTALNYVPVTGFSRRDGRIAEVVARDAETGEELRVEARSVINATGVYVDAVRRLDDPAAARLLTPSQGAHLVLDRVVPSRRRVRCLVPRTDDGRVLFAIPWHDRVLVGTTDTPVADVAIEPRPLGEEIAYLLGYVARYLKRPPEPRRRPQHVRRPAAAAPRPRRRRRRPSSRASTPWSSPTRDWSPSPAENGRPTDGWRSTRSTTRCRSAACATALDDRTLQLHGWRRADGDETVDRSRSTVPMLRPCPRCAASVRSGIDRCIPRCPIARAKSIWAARHEAARCVEDVLARRTRACFSTPAPASRPRPGRRPAGGRAWPDRAWQADQAAEFEQLARRLTCRSFDRLPFSSRSIPWDRSR